MLLQSCSATYPQRGGEVFSMTYAFQFRRTSRRVFDERDREVNSSEKDSRSQLLLEREYD